VGNKVKITMYGDELQTYENQDSTDVCGADNDGGVCSMGSKVIAVIGGELDIQGTEPTCPSWEVSVPEGRSVCVYDVFPIYDFFILLPSPHHIPVFFPEIDRCR